MHCPYRKDGVPAVEPVQYRPLAMPSHTSGGRGASRRTIPGAACTHTVPAATLCRPYAVPAPHTIIPVLERLSLLRLWTVQGETPARSLLKKGTHHQPSSAAAPDAQEKPGMLCPVGFCGTGKGCELLTMSVPGMEVRLLHTPSVGNTKVGAVHVAGTTTMPASALGTGGSQQRVPAGTGWLAMVRLSLHVTMESVHWPGANTPSLPVQCKPSDSTLQGSNRDLLPPILH